jgi:DNA-binding response OmpR family regulator
MEYRKKVLVVDDDKKLTEIIERYLSQYEFKVFIANDGKEFENIIGEEKPDLILLDVMLPGESGFDILREVQKNFDIPVIMLTAKGDEVDKVIGLEMGADDYITKPFSIRELIARIRTVLRRATAYPTDFANKKDINYESMQVIPDRRALVLYNKETELTKTEFEILYLLASNPNKTFTREELLKMVSDRDYAVFDRSIDMHISHLRNRLKEQEQSNYVIKTVWGSGYRFEVSEIQ